MWQSFGESSFRPFRGNTNISVQFPLYVDLVEYIFRAWHLMQEIDKFPRGGFRGSFASATVLISTFMPVGPA